MKDLEKPLVDAIVSALYEAERSGDIVIATTTPTDAAKIIAEGVQSVYAGGFFTPEELLAISSLIFHATADKHFYDPEMPTLVGMTAEQMSTLAVKIRSLVSL